MARNKTRKPSRPNSQALEPKRPGSAIVASRGQRYNFKNSFSAWYIIQQRLPNPDSVLRKRHGAGIEIYRELYSDPHLTAALESREARTLAIDWEIERNGCPARLAKAIESWFYKILERKHNLQDLSKGELIDNLLDVIFWGYQPAELVWDFEFGMWLPIQIIPKPPEWFTWFINDQGLAELRFLSIANSVDGEAPPDDYTLICPRIKPSFDNPYGRGVASRCFWPIVFKKAGLEFWLNFMERFGTPWVKGTTTATDAVKFAEELKALVQDAVIALSGDKNVELLETNAGSGRISEGFKILVDFMDSQISKTILGHTLSTDTQDKGSYAAIKGAMTVRDDLGDSDTRMIASIFNDVIDLIARRNGYTNVTLPVVRPKVTAVVSIERAQRDEILSRIGVKFKKPYIVRAHGLKDEEFDLVDPKPLSQGPDPKKEEEKNDGKVD